MNILNKIAEFLKNIFNNKEKEVKYNIIPVFIPHQGCPQDCIFCNQVKISGNLPNITAKEAKKEIDSYLETLKKEEGSITEIAFFGGSFTAIDIDYQNEMLKMANQYIEKGLVDGIRLSTRPDAIDEDILKKLKEYGVTTIELGVQSSNDYILKLSKRGHKFEDVIKASKLIKKHKIKLGHQMMVGLPESSMLDEINTAKEIAKLKPEMVRIYPVLVLEGTDLAKMYKDGTYIPLEVDEAVETCKRLVLFFEEKNINVIRVGLQTTDEISDPRADASEVIAGPYHPTFRQLVDSSIWYDKILKEVSKFDVKIEKAKLYIHPKETNDVVGYKRNNIKRFKERYGIDFVLEYDMKLKKHEFRIEVEKIFDDFSYSPNRFSKEYKAGEREGRKANFRIKK